MLRRHWPFALVLAAGALLRIAAEVAYRPALFYSDSWGYLSMAHGGSLVSFAPLRPSGYPLILKVLHSLTVITTVQHMAGLVSALLVYVTCQMLGVRRWLATLAGAFVVLDAWAIALEQYILTEAFFTLALTLAVWASVAALRPDSAAESGRRASGSANLALGFAGLCLAGAALMRPVALFAVPAWLIWMLWIRPGVRPALAGVGFLVVPLLVYSLAHAHTTGTFGLTQANGWFLYGRVGPIADCNGITPPRDARALCKKPAGASHENQSFFMFSHRSPARLAFGGISANSKKQAHSNAELGSFARQVILNHPWAYVKLVGADFFKYFRPGPHALHREDDTVEFPRTARIRFDDRAIRHRLYPGLRVHASSPSSALRSYASIFHTSRPLVALFTLLSIAGLVLGIRRRDPRAPALFLGLGTALGILLGAALAAGFALRYLVPVIPSLMIATAVAVSVLTGTWARSRGSKLDASVE